MNEGRASALFIGPYGNSDQWTVAVFVNNVFDKIGIRQIDQYQATEETNWRRTGVVTDPRLFGLEVRYKFGAFQ